MNKAISIYENQIRALEKSQKWNFELKNCMIEFRKTNM